MAVVGAIDMEISSYVLVTPARNEEAYLEKTINGVVAQTVRPRKWVIVSDGSTDGTDEISSRLAREHSFIEFVRRNRPTAGAKDFGSKVKAFKEGYERLGDVEYDFIGNLDADIELPPEYFEKLLAKFQANSKLGIGGGIVLEPENEKFVPQHTSLNSVCGSVQLFRRQCYEAIGGYIPIRLGGVDAAAEIMARMRGWTVETFLDLPVKAQRKVLTGGATILHTRFRHGISNYLLGYHPLFQLASSLARLNEPPYVIGSICTLSGYLRAWIQQKEFSLPPDVIRFLRAEQMQRLASSLTPVTRNAVRNYRQPGEN